MSNKKIRILSICLLIFFFLISCGKNTEKMADTKTEPEEIVLRQEGGDFGFPNPFRHQNRGPGFFKMELIYDSLLEKDEKGLIPWLAKDWNISEDGKTYTFTLVDNAKWHDGKPLTAEDIAFSVKYFEKNPPVRGGLIVNGKYLMDSVSVNGNKIIIHTTDYTPTALEKIGSMRIIPKHIWENIEDPAKFSGEGAAVGSGPYMLEEYSGEQGAYKFTAFNDFWGMKPAVFAIEWIPVSDRVSAFENKEIDIVNVSADLLKNYENNEEFKVVKNFGLHNYRFYFNFNKVPALRDKEIRKAVAYAIDKKELIDKLERGSGLEGNQGYLPPTHSMYNKNVPSYEFNLEKAKELMKGKNIQISVLTGASPKEVKMAELLKIRLKDIGIILNVVSVDSKARDTMVRDKNYETAIIKSGGMGGDADMLREIYSSKVKRPNIAGYSNEKLDDLLYRQSVEKDAEKRKALIYSVQEILADEIPMLLLYGEIDNTVYRPAKYNKWTVRYDHTKLEHPKLSYVIRP
ncbi:ABC transporter substrate-binding protein [Treponema pedis]|uniref:ABC transporter substrate-binding protein n=1 Tax=Treponema pedis TaxID=409322 RepID=UPI00197D73AB|nr:ABC transporter substrate-binding protein [Treponema pedis]QSI05285.1 DNA-binding protein [Treponema pedis]